MLFFFFSSRRRHTRLTCDWSSDVCSSDLGAGDQQRSTPHQVRRAREVGPPGVERDPKTRDEQDDRGGDEPGDLSAELGEKESIPPSEAPARSRGPDLADASGLVSGEAA